MIIACVGGGRILSASSMSSSRTNASSSSAWKPRDGAKTWVNTPRAFGAVRLIAGNLFLLTARCGGAGWRIRIPCRPVWTILRSVRASPRFMIRAARNMRLGIGRRGARRLHPAGSHRRHYSSLESAHAVAEAIKRAPRMKKSEVVIVNVSGRGDKDIGILRENLKLDS